jgi:hypothetical protein
MLYGPDGQPAESGPKIRKVNVNAAAQCLGLISSDFRRGAGIVALLIRPDVDTVTTTPIVLLPAPLDVKQTFKAALQMLIRFGVETKLLRPEDLQIPKDNADKGEPAS